MILKKKYHALHAPIFKKRDSIITGEYEPTEQECTREDSDSESDDEDDDDEEEENKPAPSKLEEKTTQQEKVKGIPEFWATVLKNNPQIAETIQEKDDAILSHLTSISFEYLDIPEDHGFALTFKFSKNKYFSNLELVKTYHLLNPPDAFGDIMFESAEGTAIQWEKDMDPTTIIESKKQRHKVPTLFTLDNLNNFYFFNLLPLIFHVIIEIGYKQDKSRKESCQMRLFFQLFYSTTTWRRGRRSSRRWIRRRWHGTRRHG